MEFMTMILRALVDGGFNLVLLIAYLGTWLVAKGKGKIWSLIMHDMVLAFIIYTILYNNGVFNK